MKCYINSELSPVVGTTYRDLRRFVEAIDFSVYFTCSPLSDDTSLQSYQTSFSNSNDQQFSGLLKHFIMIVITLSIFCLFVWAMLCDSSK